MGVIPFFSVLTVWFIAGEVSQGAFLVMEIGISNDLIDGAVWYGLRVEWS